MPSGVGSNGADARTFSFGGFRLDLERGSLADENGDIELRPKSFEVLRYLVGNAGRLVAKDELLSAVWPNLAASDESLARCISDVRTALRDGESRIIKTVPRRGYRFTVPVTASGGSATTRIANRAAAVPAAGGLSIAVLPFVNIGGDPEQEYFADGVVEDITTALSRFRSLLVIARQSSFTYKGKTTDVKQVGRELNVRYVLEGSVRRAAKRLRITAQLIDTSTGTHLWADRFDGAIEDIFELQDQVTTSVVGATTPTLERAEICRAALKPTDSLDAYDHYMRGIASEYQLTSEATGDALRHYYKAIELDPEFALAHALAAGCYTWRKTNGWVTDSAREMAETRRLTERAVLFGQDDAQVLCWSGSALAFVVGEVDAGTALVERALRLNPNLMDGWLTSGLTRLVSGEWNVAIEHFARAMRLSPFDPLLFLMQHGTASGHFYTGRHDEAAAWAARSVGENPNYSPAWRIVAASNALLGRQQQARKAVARLHQLEPALRIATIDSAVPLGPSDLVRLEEGLRKAGLPE